jgi:hypothetical protein
LASALRGDGGDAINGQKGINEKIFFLVKDDLRHVVASKRQKHQ